MPEMSNLRRLLPAAVACALLVPVLSAMEQAPPASTAPATPNEFKALKYRPIGPAAGGRVSRVAGVPGDPTTYYAATASGGVWKSTRRRRDLELDLRRSAGLLDRIDRRRAIEPERRLRRLGRGQHPRQRRRRQRHLQVDRRRQDLDARLEAGRPDRHDGRAPDQPRHRVRRGARPRLRPEPGARRLPHDGRRQDVAAGPEEGRGHRRLRRRDGSVEPGDPLRRLLAGAPPAVGSVERRARQRPLRLARRRRHLEAAHRQRPARRHLGQGRRRGRAVRRPARLRADRSGEGRAVPIGRRRRELGARQPSRAAPPARLVLLDADREPARTANDVWFPQVPLLHSIDGGKTLQVREGHCRTATITTSGSIRRTRSA